MTSSLLSLGIGSKGHTSPMQDVWLENLRSEGYFVAVCRGAVEAVHAIERYLEMT